MLARPRSTTARHFTAGPHFTAVAEWEVAHMAAAGRISQWVGAPMAAAQEVEVAHMAVARRMAVVARMAAAIASEPFGRAGYERPSLASTNPR
jgi:hypothetical protein